MNQNHSETVFGWETDTALNNSPAIHELKQKIEDEVYKEINGIIVIKNGKLLVEAYFNGAHRELPHNPRSVGKTFASAMMGIAIRDGFLTSVDQTLDQFYELELYANFDPKKRQVSLKHLLTMSSGFDGFDFDPASIGNEENMYPQDDWVKWALDLPIRTEDNPGDNWFYFTAGAVILGDILHQVLPGGLEAYADKTLFKPMGITNYRWQYTPQGVANTAGGIQLTPLDFAKFGYLYKNIGRWGETQILPTSWVVDSFTPYLQTVNPGDRYGYLWWTRSYEIDDIPYETYYCSGNGGNKIYVFTELDVVVVVTASAYGRRYMHSQVDEIMQHYLLPTILQI